MTNIYFESVLMAWSSIVSNKMRSLLTMLGIIIGVAAVIALMSIGYGVQDSIKSDISRLGSNTITVTPGTGRKPGVKVMGRRESAAREVRRVAVIVFFLYHG